MTTKLQDYKVNYLNYMTGSHRITNIKAINHRKARQIANSFVNTDELVYSITYLRNDLKDLQKPHRIRLLTAYIVLTVLTILVSALCYNIYTNL